MASNPSGTTNLDTLEAPVVMVSTWAKPRCAMAAREASTTRISSRRNRSMARVSRCHPSAGALARCCARLTCALFAAGAALRAGVGLVTGSLLPAVVLGPLSASPDLPGESSDRLDDLPSAGAPGALAGNIRCSISTTVFGGSGSSSLLLPLPPGLPGLLPASFCGLGRLSSSSSSLALAFLSFLSLSLDPESRALLLLLLPEPLLPLALLPLPASELPRELVSERPLLSREPLLQGLSLKPRSRRGLAPALSPSTSTAAKPMISASQPARQHPRKNDESFPISRFRLTRLRPPKPNPQLSAEMPRAINVYVNIEEKYGRFVAPDQARSHAGIAWLQQARR